MPVTACVLDSSALVKRYGPEPGTACVRTMTTPSAGNTVLVAQLMQACTYPYQKPSPEVLDRLYLLAQHAGEMGT